MMCPHGGTVMPMPTTLRVTLNRQPVLVLGDPMVIAGCAFTMGGPPMPCVTAQATSGALRVKALGKPVLLIDSVVQTMATTPGLPVLTTSTQTRVRAR